MTRIQDEFSDLPIGSQRKWHLRNRRDGLCVICGVDAAPSKRKGAGGTSSHCAKHRAAIREQTRRRRNFQRRNQKAESYSGE
jgi:hypothetical protein